MKAWWESFFDAEYLRIWSAAEPSGQSDAEVDGLCTLLGLSGNSRVLDAPSGYGRIARGLAARGIQVLGVDYSESLLQEAERRREGISEARLRYRRHDLRTPLADTGFDVALNIYSSLGYGSEADDLAILTTLRDSVHAHGRVFIETTHRDSVVRNLSRIRRPGHRLPDGTLLLEEPRFDPIAGRVETTWYWSGPHGAGQKSASLRIYAVTELLQLLASAGLVALSFHDGCSPEPFADHDTSSGNRLGILAAKK